MTSPPSRGRAIGRVLLLLLAGGLVVGLGPLARVRAYSMWVPGDTAVPRALALVVAISLALVGVARLQGRLASLLAVVVAAGAGAAMYPLQGKTLAVWLAFTTLAAAWGVHRVRPPGLPRPDGSATPGLVVLSLLAALSSGDTGGPPRTAFLFTALMVLPLALSLPGPFSRFVRPRIDRVAIRVGQAVSVCLLAVLSIVAVVLPWAVQRLVRWDPVATSSPGGWIPRSSDGLQARRMWSREAEGPRVPALRRLHGFVASVVTGAAVLVLAAGALAVTPTWGGEDDGAGAPHDEEVPVVAERMRAEPWFDQLSSENALMYRRGWLSQWVGSELGDVDGDFLVVDDGRRASWEPPAPTCGELLDVWVFGGSTTFSVGARDEHTIPSELSRRAAEDGLALRMTNWGVPGDVAWQEGRRLERGILNGMDPPDLVVFFDGFNDMSSSGNLGPDRGEVGDYIGPLDRLHMAALSELGSVEDGDRYLLELPTPENPGRTPEDVAESALHQYLAADESARRFLEGDDISSVRFAQPSLWSRDEPVEGEPLPGDFALAVDEAFRAGLPDRIVDLGDMFDPADGAIYNDDVHTDERGNGLIADELYRHLRGQLRRLAVAGGAPCS